MTLAGQLFGSSVYRIELEEGDHHGVLGQQLTYGKKVCAPFARYPGSRVYSKNLGWKYEYKGCKS